MDLKIVNRREFGPLRRLPCFTVKGNEKLEICCVPHAPSLKAATRRGIPLRQGVLVFRRAYAPGASLLQLTCVYKTWPIGVGEK